MYQSRDRINRTLVTLTLTDDSVIIVSVRLPLSNKLGDALNAPEPFLDVITPGGEQQFIAKASVRSVRSMVMPSADQLDLDARQTAMADLDAHSVLKLEKDAGPEEIRQAYHRMAKLYHPDRIASYELPEEIKDYTRAMLVRINLAFEKLRR
jgi:hypothetical protein